MNISLKLLLLSLFTFVGAEVPRASNPNIVIIVADDMGFDDVSFHGSNEFLTPNIDALGYHGVVLNKFYVPPMCTPSRATLMTGRYPISTGMHHFVIENTEPWGLGLDETTIGEVFKSGGYATHMIGKWHLGFYKEEYTPAHRGFDNFYGYYGAYVDYWDRTLIVGNETGYDFRRGTEVNCEGNDTYVTDLFTNEAVRVISTHEGTSPFFMIVNHLAPHGANDADPLQAPQEVVEQFAHIRDEKRRVYAAMVSKLDESVGKIVQSLSQKGILENTIILFYSDNGAPIRGLFHTNSGSNYPLKGQKNSPWEGAVRSSAVVWTSSLKKSQSVWNQKLYVADLLPTLAAAAGITPSTKHPLDGRNYWEELVGEQNEAERAVVHNIDDVVPYTSYMAGPWKFVNGSTQKGAHDDWLSHRSEQVDPRSAQYEAEILSSMVTAHLSAFSALNQSTIKTTREQVGVKCPPQDNSHNCKASEGCLFHIDDDPCERNNLAQLPAYSAILQKLQADVEAFRKTAQAPRNAPSDPNALPSLHRCVWSPWLDEPPAEEGECLCSHT